MNKDIVVALAIIEKLIAETPGLAEVLADQSLPIGPKVKSLLDLVDLEKLTE